MTWNTSIDAGEISALISIITPFVLILWFYYSQKQILSDKYFTEITGIYAGFTIPEALPKYNGQIYAGIIMNIRNVDSKGFFKGDFDYAETESYTQDAHHKFGSISDGIYSFFGDLEFEIYKSKKRNPFKLTENRCYSGNLYIVDRMDFQIENYKLEDYLIAEYSVVHYREMETIKFKLKKVYKKVSQKLPNYFVLYKSSGLFFEPYKSLKTTVFLQTRVDL